MSGFDLIEKHEWHVGKLFGSDNPFWSVNIHTIFHTWAILTLVLILLLTARYFLHYNNGTPRFLVLSYINFFIDLCNQSFPQFNMTHFSFVTTIFTFILLCNTISIIPGLEEPTTDLNTTLALGIISFFYTQIVALRAHGFLSYIKEYFSPIFIMFPIHVIGKLSSIVSLSFRLFGNIIGGAIITMLLTSAGSGSWLWESLKIASGLNIIVVLFFGLFEGFLQAYVFTMLSVTNISIALQSEEDEH
jgi:F-type H+-transporting ATPase subunit a